ncbi:MFS transporter [Solimonas marina]|uniref:MFS transporter n=1 Tax=Solimonas marina TaxID=2714601 RepID=A0A969WBI4_9GAMM|nr:MFS transporter [Solimonas marina]NKF22983.1 MFS transporter [Solimonas marina]
MLAMLALIVAGEAVFMLPFVVARVFRATFLTVFDLTNLQLGSAFSVYGVIAMVSYLLGGPLADRYPARSLIAIALLATSLGGIVFAGIPSIAGLTLLYGFWGVTTVLLFWAALIRATREWGGITAQGRAYGLLDGGRGVLAAILATAAVALFGHLLPAQAAAADAAQLARGMRAIILATTAFTALAAVLAWFALPGNPPAATADGPRLSWAGVRAAARFPSVWLQALVIVCAYVAYKVTDVFGLYAHDVLGYDDVAAARLGSLTFWARPVAALAAGWLADRLRASQVVIGGFALLGVGALPLAAGWSPLAVPAVLMMVLAITSLGIYGVRGVYFSVMNEMRLPLAMTGSAAGLVSVIGFTPDIFAGPLIGALLDRAPGAAGFHQVFAMTAGFAAVGLIAALALARLTRPLREAVQR